MSVLQDMASSAPVNFDTAKLDWAGVDEALKACGVAPGEVLATTWCSIGHMNIEALVDSPALAIVHQRGVVGTVGKRKMLGGGVKFDAIDFAKCRSYGPCEYTDDRGLGKFCIEFAGPGNVLLGRMQWSWRAKRFRDSSEQIMAVAEERDRILSVISGVLG